MKTNGDRVIALIEQAGKPMSLEEVNQALGDMHYETVSTTVRRLVARGLLTRVGYGVYGLSGEKSWTSHGARVFIYMQQRGVPLHMSELREEFPDLHYEVLATTVRRMVHDGRLKRVRHGTYTVADLPLALRAQGHDLCPTCGHALD